jgi:hypothetical protein
MKKIVVLLFLILCVKLSAQTAEKSIILLDAESKLPIEDATVVILKNKQIFLSNVEGKVTLDLKGASNIQISHTSYKTMIIRSAILKEKETVVYIKSNVNTLDEIILTKQHPQKILASLIDNSKKKLNVPVRLKVYCREFFKLNGKYSYYNDGLINFQLLSKTKDFNSTILVEQNRSIGLIDANVSSELLGYNLNDIMENYYNFKYLLPLLDPKAKKEYDFLVKVNPNNENYYVMTAIPNDNGKGLQDDFSITYDKKKKIIIEVSSVLTPMTVAKMKDKTSNGSKNINKSLFKTIYRSDEDEYYLISSKEEIGFERNDKNGKKQIEVRNYFVTTNFSTQNYSFKDSEVFKDKTLFNKKNEILTDYWNVSGLVATDEEQKIIESIEDRLYEE